MCRSFSRLFDPETLDELERIGDELAVEFDGKLEEFAGLVHIIRSVYRRSYLDAGL